LCEDSTEGGTFSAIHWEKEGKRTGRRVVFGARKLGKKQAPDRRAVGRDFDMSFP